MSFNVAAPCVVAFVAVAVVVLIGAGPARPGPTVSYGFDGVTWSPELSSPLFDRSIRWVPGDSRSSEFHVFNDTDNDGRLQVFVDSDNAAFRQALTVGIDGRDTTSRCGVVVVGAHEQRVVKATVNAAVEAGNDTQNASAGIDLVLQWDNETSELCSVSSGAGPIDRQEGA